MTRLRSSFLLIVLALASLGCQERSPDPAMNERAGTSETLWAVVPDRPAEIPAALLSLYKTLNLRSFNSSLGPRLKFHCESYLFEYFPQSDINVDSPHKMTLVNGDDTWVIEVLTENSIRVENIISGMGSYHSTSELSVQPIEATGDIRANDTWIEQRADCTPLRPQLETVLGLRDHRPVEAATAWVCGEFWSGSDVTPELGHWKGLAELAGDSNPSQNNWGPSDMLTIDVRDYAALSKQCDGSQQLREVVRISAFDQPDGNEIGTFVYIATFAHGLLEMVGYVTLTDEQSHKVYFDLMRKEQVVLLFSQRNGDWINISPSDTFNAWINVQGFDLESYSVGYLPYLQRVASADEINLLTDTPRNVHVQASSTSAVVFTLGDTRTALTPIAIEGDWMHVKFVPPPDYPLIGCGDDPEDFAWISGWIQWRDGSEWFTAEEHHYGC